jgi:hypothetical protein
VDLGVLYVVVSQKPDGTSEELTRRYNIRKLLIGAINR